MSVLSITAKGRTLTMYFDLAAWLEVEETFGSLEKLWAKVDADDEPMKTQLQLAAIVANAGERKAGREPDITTEWLRDNLSPKQARTINTLAKIAMSLGLKRETADDDDETGDIDVTAKELLKKKPDQLPQENA